jgi:hypothetical protein
MSNLWMGISPGPRDTRVIAMAGPSETISKARLSRQSSHPRALPTMLEAIALWQGVHVHARFVRPTGMGRPTRASIAMRSPTSAARCTRLEWVPAASLGRRLARDIRGVGDVADLRRFLIAEGTR